MATKSRTGAIALVVLGLFGAACADAEVPIATAAPRPTTTAVAGQRAPLAGTKAPTTTAPATTLAPPGSTTTTSSTTTTTTEAVVAVGTVDDPVALGSPRLVGEWVITVSSVDTDAEETVLRENPFNEEGAEDEAFVLVDLDLTYVGSDTAYPWIEIDHWMLGEGNVVYRDPDSGCGAIPNDLFFVGEVFPGGTVSGSVCHKVAADDSAVATLVIEESFSFDEADAAVFALHDGIGSSPTEPLPPVPPIPTEGPLGSWANPIEFGSPGFIGDWLVTVDSVDLDATAAVLAENPFNNPPPPGHSYVLVTIAATNEGVDAGDPWFDIRDKVIGEMRVTYEGFEVYCGVVPQDLANVGQVSPGDSFTASFCWAVPDDELESLLLILQDNNSFDAGRLFYDLG